VASSSREPARPQGNQGQPVKPDIVLGEAKAADYDAIIFCGGEGVKEYCKEKEYPQSVQSAHKIIEEMRAAKKYVTAICMGPLVFAEAGVLKGVRATCINRCSAMLEQKGATWVDKPVVVSDRIITGRHWKDAEEFARQVLDQLRKS